MHELGHLPLLITSFEFGSCATLSLLTMLVQKQNPTDAPRLSLLRISLLVLASLVSGNVALKWVSYPVKVVVNSLDNSVSVAALVLTTEALVHDEPKELTKDQELAAMDQMAGMGGMEYM